MPNAKYLPRGEESVMNIQNPGMYWAFLLVAPPLPVTRAVGTPINPYALK